MEVPGRHIDKGKKNHLQDPRKKYPNLQSPIFLLHQVARNITLISWMESVQAITGLCIAISAKVIIPPLFLCWPISPIGWEGGSSLWATTSSLPMILKRIPCCQDPIDHPTVFRIRYKRKSRVGSSLGKRIFPFEILSINDLPPGWRSRGNI